MYDISVAALESACRRGGEIPMLRTIMAPAAAAFVLTLGTLAFAGAVTEMPTCGTPCKDKPSWLECNNCCVICTHDLDFVNCGLWCDCKFEELGGPS